MLHHSKEGMEQHHAYEGGAKCHQPKRERSDSFSTQKERGGNAPPLKQRREVKPQIPKAREEEERALPQWSRDCSTTQRRRKRNAPPTHREKGESGTSLLLSFFGLMMPSHLLLWCGGAFLLLLWSGAVACLILPGLYGAAFLPLPFGWCFILPPVPLWGGARRVA